MFFPERICSINRRDKVLEIGPGNSPHPRADVLLERRFSDWEAREQRGHTPELNTRKPLIFYDGGIFPFGDGEFDYVICSHVIEHVEDVEGFCSEMFRIARRGYIEFPTVYYEYLYNFAVHKQLVNFSCGELRYMGKEESGLGLFSPVQALFYRSLELGFSDLINDLKTHMFQGVEWLAPFAVRKAENLHDLVGASLPLDLPPRPMRDIRRILRWLEDRLCR